MLTPCPAHCVACPSSTHTPRGLHGCGGSNSFRQHSRGKHRWQMGRDIRYQVSAWKIYKVTRQWEADTKRSYLPSAFREPIPPTAAKPTLVSAGMKKIISRLILSVFSSMQHRLDYMCSYSWIRSWWLTRKTCFGVLIEDRAVRHKRTCCYEIKEFPTHGKRSLGSGKVGQDGAGSCPCHPVSQSAAGRLSQKLTSVCIK